MDYKVLSLNSQLKALVEITGQKSRSGSRRSSHQNHVRSVALAIHVNKLLPLQTQVRELRTARAPHQGCTPKNVRL